MYKRRPDLGPIPVPEFRSFEPVTTTSAVRATGPVAQPGFSHLEAADAVPVQPGELPQVRFLAPVGNGSVYVPEIEDTDDMARHKRRNGRQRRHRRGQS